jgi:antitoxin (DNA-binding transcriptional repressor) of toxin-antitoxin stability system
MSTYSLTEAEGQLARLIDRALAGESVMIDVHGHQVVEIRPVRNRARPSQNEALPSLARKRARLQAGVDPVAVLMQMRDDDWR